jgi:hypothetical protein
VDLGEYTRLRRQYLRTIGACCLYAVCPDLEKPCRIGSTNDIVATLEMLQRGCWFRLKAAFVLWTPSKHIGRRIEFACQAKCEIFRLDGEWFEIQAATAAEVFEQEAKSIYPTVSYLTHNQMIEHLKYKVKEKAA